MQEHFSANVEYETAVVLVGVRDKLQLASIRCRCQMA